MCTVHEFCLLHISFILLKYFIEVALLGSHDRWMALNMTFVYHRGIGWCIWSHALVLSAVQTVEWIIVSINDDFMLPREWLGGKVLCVTVVCRVGEWSDIYIHMTWLGTHDHCIHTHENANISFSIMSTSPRFLGFYAAVATVASWRHFLASFCYVVWFLAVLCSHIVL